MRYVIENEKSYRNDLDIQFSVRHHRESISFNIFHLTSSFHGCEIILLQTIQMRSKENKIQTIVDIERHKKNLLKMHWSVCNRERGEKEREKRRTRSRWEQGQKIVLYIWPKSSSEFTRSFTSISFLFVGLLIFPLILIRSLSLIWARTWRQFFLLSFNRRHHYAHAVKRCHHLKLQLEQSKMAKKKICWIVKKCCVLLLLLNMCGTRRSIELASAK